MEILSRNARKANTTRISRSQAAAPRRERVNAYVEGWLYTLAVGFAIGCLLCIKHYEPRIKQLRADLKSAESKLKGLGR